MRSPRSKRAADSVSQLKAAALDVFNEVGVNAASIHDICGRAGVSIGSAYHHFGSKQGLADALLLEGLQHHLESLRRRLHKAHTAREGVTAVVESLIKWIERHPKWARFIYTAADHGVRDEIRDALKDVNRDYEMLIDNFFRPFVEDGLLRSFPPGCFISLLIGPVHHYARKSLGKRAHKPLGSYADEFSQAAWCTVRAEDSG
ncbi:MAG: TetR/AcrR family transcriptional regulator [Myxococcota bacterium]